MSNKQKLDFNNLLPSSLKNETLTSLMSNLFNRFTSEENSIVINGRIGKPQNNDSQITQNSLDRELNAIIPAVYFKQGTEEFVSNFNDCIDRLEVLNADVDNMQSWLSEQSYNYTLPIDYDKFTNYANYYWINKASTNTPLWNKDLKPEYYVIQRPRPNDLIKYPVNLATTRHINLYANDRPPETFTLTFTSNTTFTITSTLSAIISSTNSLIDNLNNTHTLVELSTTDSNIAPGIDDPDSLADKLCSFYIVNGTTQFAAGDKFTITVHYFTSNNTTSFSSSNLVGKGAISGINTISSNMYIDGIKVKSGHRILVKDQIDPSENGIYLVHSYNKWERTVDAKYESNLNVGSIIFVEEGNLHAGNTFELSSKTQLSPLPNNLIHSNITFSLLSTTLPKPINEWQEYNLWYHKDDFDDLQSVGIFLSDATQANRPIIEYNNSIQLNTKITSDGYPTDEGTIEIKQIKSRFNQLPQFDLFRYDGTHNNTTSGIFYYIEDPDFSVDEILQKRVKTTDTYDFVFGTSLQDNVGRLLFYKENGLLKSIWQLGVTAPTVTSLHFEGTTLGADITFNSISNIADTQLWTFTCLTPTTFSIVGTRSGNVGTATVNVPFVCDDFTVTISNLMFNIGETFTFNILNAIHPRYVKKQNSDVINYPGGQVGDKLDGVIDGTWLTPLRMFRNLERETRSEIAYGDLINHTRNVIKNQDGFTGASHGNNNVRNLTFNPGYGGTINEFNSNFPLLLSMLIQKESSPLTILDFAEQQYNIAISSVDQFLANELAQYIAKNVIVTDTINSSAADIIALENYFEELRANNQNLKEVFSDSTALVKNWPVTLPMIGLKPASIPGIKFDAELGFSTIVHHDGHISPISERSADFDRLLVRTIVDRSDGSKTPGVFSESYPTTPYLGQLWLKPSTFELSIFDVTYDTDTTPLNGSIGQIWYKRNTNQIYEWDSIGNIWIPSIQTSQNRWTPFNTAAIRTSLILAIENKLYSSVHPAQQLNLDISTANDANYSQIELAKFSAKYNYDTYAPDYVSSNPYTWNYKQSVIPGLLPVPARWYDIYKKYFDIPGQTLPTCRPNLEPWKLLNFATKPLTWDSTYKCTNLGSTNIVNAVAVATYDIPTLIGLTTIDGIALNAGDTVLLTNQTLPQFNGLYTVSNSGWSRTADILVNQITIHVQDGYEYANSVWSLTSATPGILLGTIPLVFEQVRLWNDQMWADIIAARPTLKLCVNIRNDELLPPYVSNTAFSSAQALLNVIPIGISDGYQFGDNGPIELIWAKSLEYAYGLCRNYFRLNPLEFLDKSWGETYMHVGNNLRIERNTASSLPASKFLFHGEKLNVINTYSNTEASKRIITLAGGSISVGTNSKITFEVTHCADDITVLYAYINDALVGMIYEGSPFNIPLTDGVQITNVKIDDLGIPFELGEKFTIDDTLTVTHQQATVRKFKGIGQLFTNLLRYSYIDTNLSNASLAYKGWSVYLSHRIGALIKPDSLTINTQQGILPSTAFSNILKKSSNTENKWISALRIQLVQMGTKTLNSNGIYVPTGSGEDWVFRIETYNPQYPIAEYYSLDTNDSYETFFALNKQTTDIEWKHYNKKTSILSTTTPLTITGIQNVVNFIYGYSDLLYDNGWRFNTGAKPVTDSKTGRNLDWQLEIEKFIDTIYVGISAGDGHILNPFISRLNLATPIGLMSRYTESNFIDSYAMQAAFDVTGVAIPIKNLNVTRLDDDCTTVSSTPIFSAHVFIDEYEHLLLINKKFSEDVNSTTLFDPFLGAYINTAFLTYIKNDSSDRKPTFGGFFINGNTVNRNIVSSIDSIGAYYDSNKSLKEVETSNHSLALLGFENKEYFDNININKTTQFNFWRGLIQAKGTNLTIDAFANYKKFNDAKVDEYWAYKLAEFGDAREKSLPEIKINSNDTTQKFTKLQFYSINDSAYDPLPLFTQIENNDDTRWFSIDDLGKGMKFEAQKIVETVNVSNDLTFPAYIRLNNIFHNGDSSSPQVTGPFTCSVINASLIKVSGPGEYTVTGFTWLNPSKLSPIKLFDYKDNILIDEIGLWHPAIGIHAYAPLELINIIKDEDPANYNYSTLTTSNSNLAHLKPWGLKEVGRIWWDTSNLGYIPYYDGNIFTNRESRHSRWGSLAEWASVDLYQWTESSVHPSEYDTLAASQEGNAEIDKSQRLSGKVGFNKYYSRNRIIKMRPIAWSKAGTNNSNAHPSFGPATFTSVFVAGNLLIADKGRVASINLINGRNFGGWANNKPVGEVEIGTEISYDIGSSSTISMPILIPSGNISNIQVANLENTLFGTRIGAIILSKVNQPNSKVLLRMTDSTGYTEDIELSDWFSDDLISNSTKTYNFNTFGLKVTVTRTTTGIITSNDLADSITNTNNDVYIREAVNFTEILPLPDILFVNDENDPLYQFTEYQWKTWEVPTQTQLSNDLSYPHNMWLPYVGDEITVSPSITLIENMNNSASSLMLKSGIMINRFNTTWTEWIQLKNIKREFVSNGSTVISTDFGELIDINRLSIYKNGIQLNKSSYQVDGTSVTLLNIVDEGATILVLYRAYQPTISELAFNPDISDDFSIQTQYKTDYQYTYQDIRNSEGVVIGTKYYFWVQDKNIPDTNKNMSLVEAKNILKNGPSTFTIFARLLNTNDESYYDSCAIAGLSSLVTKNDSFKLRFLRDFTLRDDPNEIDLKNTHTEWTLIRKNQASKIPKSLWDLLTDAVCGEDKSGNSLPSKTRIDYDERNGTNTRFGFKQGQIFAATELVKNTITNTILNTSVVINLGSTQITDYITALNFDESDLWFSTPENARNTMNLIWVTARPSQINEIFFNCLYDALDNNYEFSDIFKTSFINVSSISTIEQALQTEQENDIF